MTAGKDRSNRVLDIASWNLIEWEKIRSQTYLISLKPHIQDLLLEQHIRYRLWRPKGHRHMYLVFQSEEDQLKAYLILSTQTNVSPNRAETNVFIGAFMRLENFGGIFHCKQPPRQ